MQVSGLQEPFKYTTWSTYGIDEYALLHAVPIFTYVPRAVLLCTDCGVSGYMSCPRGGVVYRVYRSTAHVDFATFGIICPFDFHHRQRSPAVTRYRGADRTMINLGGFFFFLVLKTT